MLKKFALFSTLSWTLISKHFQFIITTVFLSLPYITILFLALTVGHSRYMTLVTNAEQYNKELSRSKYLRLENRTFAFQETASFAKMR